MFELVGWALEDEHGVLSNFRLKDYWFFDFIQHDGTEHSPQDIHMSATLKSEQVKVVKIFKQVGEIDDSIPAEDPVAELKIKIEKELCRILDVPWTPTVSIRTLLDSTEFQLKDRRNKLDKIQEIVVK